MRVLRLLLYTTSWCVSIVSQGILLESKSVGHPQALHETSHGSMSHTQWVLDSPDGSVEVNGHRYGNNDEGAPLLCNLYCTSVGRHVHVAPCIDSAVRHYGEGREHASAIQSRTGDPLDWISHRLHWEKSGFKGAVRVGEFIFPSLN